MRARWPVEEADDEVAFVRSRYFLATGSRERALVRNGIARLWWYGQTAYDPSLDDPYELVPYMMTTQSVAADLVERSISRCPKVALSVLRALKLAAEEGRPVRNRESFRALMRWMNLNAAVTILDSLPQEKLLSVIRNRIEEIRDDDQEGDE